jgi:hypothetical protein
MSANPLRPRLTLGAFAVGTSPDLIVFQYNPEQLTRRVEPQTVGGEADRAYGVRLTGAPKETIELQLRFDATDGLEHQDPVTKQLGVANRLARLELLAYPDIASVAQRAALLDQGVIEIVPDYAPQLLLLLGPNRSLPVKIDQYSVSEQQFDTLLNPIRATVDISMHALTYSDVLSSNPAYGQFVAYQQALVRFASTVSGSPLSGSAALVQ